MSIRILRHDDSTVGSQIASALVGAVAGVAVGLVLAQTVGGVSGIAARFRGNADDEPAYEPGFDVAADDLEDEIEDELLDEWEDEEAEEVDDVIGERVLEAFRNDPTLAARPIDIDVGPDATIELTGQVDEDREADYAATIAGGVPGVRHVVTRLGVKGRGWAPRTS